MAPTGTAVAVLEDAPAYVPDVDEKDDHHLALLGQLEIWKTLEDAGFITAVALDLSTVELSVDEACSIARYFGTVKRRSSWYLGDLLLDSENRHGEYYAQVAHETGLASQTLLNLVWVAKNVPSSRRVPGLAHSVHAEVASLSAKEQKAWLAQAKKHDWSRSELREAMKAKRKEDKPQLFGDEGEDFDDDGESISPAQVMEVARAILRDATPHEDGQHHLVPNEDVARLKALFGEED
jgi:hypothetical protein